MLIKYGVDIQDNAIQVNLKRLVNQIYKLLPIREEGANWQRPLETIIEEISGMSELLIDQHIILFKLLCKLEGLFNLSNEDDFMIYRGVIFECLGLMKEVQDAFR